MQLEITIKWKMYIFTKLILNDFSFNYKGKINKSLLWKWKGISINYS